MAIRAIVHYRGRVQRAFTLFLFYKGDAAVDTSPWSLVNK